MKKTLIISLIVALIIFSAYRLFGFSALFPADISEELPRSGSYPKRDLKEVKNIVIHHSASENQSAKDYAQYHISKGWPGIGYHYVIERSGKVFQTNPLENASYHVSGYNRVSVGICLSGNLSIRPMTGAQKRSLKALISRLKIKFPNIQVRGHRDFSNTDCPGTQTKLEELG